MTAPSKNAYKVTLPSDTELVMTRTFNAPRELVFRAHVDPALIPQWWGWRTYTTTVETLDARPGGKWHFASRGPDGSVINFFGEYREVVAPERITWTFGYDGLPEGVEPGEETYTFEEHDGRTTLTSYTRFKTKEERDGLLATGMEGGANESAERMDEMLARLQA
jgi:uncharacterized protein YndB with AHSA1/START domain